MKFINKSILVCLALLLFSCESDYQKMESKALESGEIHNDLFLGLELGMDKKSFYEVCWDLNKEGILSNGPTELSVEYNVDMPSGKPAKMRFYPKFKDEKIYLMPVEFNYESWALWNEELSVDKLTADVVALFEKWYGAGFIEVANEDRSQIAFIKMDGNRRIRVFKKSVSSVRAEIVDLPIQKNLDPNEL